MFENDKHFQSLFADIYQRNFDHLLDKFDIVSHGHYIAAVPFDTPDFIVQGIVATMATYSLNNKSIDYTLKKYGEHWSVAKEKTKSEEQFFLNEILDIVQTEVYEVNVWFNKIENKPDVFGLAVASAALMRLQSSFRTAGLLIRLGYIFESSALCRMILEQVAWAYAVHEINNENVYKISVTKSISGLKEIFPNAGNTYGFLSKFTHIDPVLITQYLSVKDENTIQVGLNSWNERLDWAWALLFLVDYYGVIFEYIFRNMQTEFSRIEQDDRGNCIPSEKRKTLDSVKRYQKKLSKDNS